MPRRVDPFGTYFTERSVTGNRLKDISLAYSKRRSWVRWLNYGRKVAKGIALFGGGAGLATAALGTAAEYGVGKAVDYFSKSKMDAPNTEPRRAPKRSYSTGSILPNHNKVRVIAPTKPDKGGYTQLQYSNGKAGTRLKKEARAMKSLVAGIYTVIDRFQWLGNGTSQFGKYDLAAQTNASNDVIMPLWCFDLTSMTQDAGIPPGAPQYAVPLQRLRFNAGVDNWKWSSELGVVKDYKDTAITSANTTYTWQTERGPRLVSKTVSGLGGEDPKCTPRAFLDWADIRLLMYGARARPSRISVQVVQFKDDLMVPDMKYTVDGTTILEAEVSTSVLSANDFNRYKDFWLSVTDTLVSNPLVKRGSTKIDSVIDVLYHKTFDFNPTMLDENDATGHQVAFNFNYGINKICDYAWDVDNSSIVDNTIQYSNAWQAYRTSSTVNTSVPRRGRVFLMISGMTTEVLGAAATDVDKYNKAASFDLCVRRKSNHLHGITADV